MKLCEVGFPCWRSIREGRTGTINVYREQKHGGFEFIIIVSRGTDINEVKMFYKLEDVISAYGNEGWQPQQKERIQ